MKHCPGCGVTKPPADFSKWSKGKDGLQPRCRVCQAAYSRAWFEANRERRRVYVAAYRADNRDLVRAARRRQAAANAEQRREHRRSTDYRLVRHGQWLQRRYGITRADYDRLMANQEGRCAICGRVPEGDSAYPRLCVDHEHGTGVIRGLLCDPCNRGLGDFGDNAEWLRRAAAYLERPPPG